MKVDKLHEMHLTLEKVSIKASWTLAQAWWRLHAAERWPGERTRLAIACSSSCCRDCTYSGRGRRILCRFACWLIISSGIDSCTNCSEWKAARKGASIDTGAAHYASVVWSAPGERMEPRHPLVLGNCNHACMAVCL